MRKNAKGEVKVGAHILGTLSLWEDMRPQHTTALTDSHEHWDPCQRYLTWHVRTLYGVWNTCCPLRFRSQVVRDYVDHALLSIHEVRYKRKLTPCDDNTNGGICPTCNAESCKVPNMVVCRNGQQ